MATTVVYADNDGWVYGLSATYATARSTAVVAIQANAQLVAGQYYGSGGEYNVIEGFVSFDTSAIPAGDTVSAVTLSLMRYNHSSKVDFIQRASVRDFGTSVTTADWVAGASLSGLTLDATYSTSSSSSTTVYQDMASEAGLPARVNKGAGAHTRFILWSNRDEAGTAPGTGAGTNEYESWRGYITAGTTQDPKLTITHAAAGFAHSQAVVIA